MVLFASQVQQQIYASQMAMMQQNQGAMQLSMQMGLMPQMSAFGAVNQGQGGVYGEQLASRLANGGRTAMGLGSLAMGVAGAASGLPLDPFSAAWSFGKAGLAAGGMPGMFAGAAVGALPFYAAGKVADVYGGAFTGGMREQASTNSMLRNNFNFQGGQGAFGRGFSQNQMGQVGSVISSEIQKSPFTSSQEMNSLISQGAEAGMFTAVRDVEQFTKRFRSMLDGLKKIQKELGGTLSEALQFTRGAQQLGIYTNPGRQQLASEMRDTMSTTGMDQQQLFSLAAQGSMLSRATGGVGRQGAMGALRTARTLGSALQSGSLNQELLSEATGGLQGTDAINAFTQTTLHRAERFSRTARGRYSLFALSNATGTGLDEGMLERFRAGDISVGGVMRDANRNASRMGRARAMNQEGRLRGAMLEEGGMSAQIGMMRLMLGDRALEGGDNLAQLVMQRRMGFSQQESQVWTSLMRNQGQIAQSESVDRAMGRRQVSEQEDIRVNRSLDAFMGHLTHGVQEATGVMAARKAGREFVTKISTIAERAMNDFLGIQASALNTKDNQALTRLSMGMATDGDLARLRGASGGGGRGAAGDVFQKSLAFSTLDTLESVSRGMFHSGRARTRGEMMGIQGIDMRKLSVRDQMNAMRRSEMAERGLVEGRADEFNLAYLNDRSDTRRRMLTAEFGGGAREVFSMFGREGVSNNAVLAYGARNGLTLEGGRLSDAAGLANQGSRLWNGAGRIAAQGLQGALTGGAAGGLMGGLWGAAAGAVVGGAGYAALQGGRELDMPVDEAASFIARGGNVGREARGMRAMLEAGARTGNIKAVADSVAKRAKVLGIGVEEAMQIARGLQNPPDVTTMQKVLQSDTFQTGIRRLSGLKGTNAINMEIAALEKEVGSMTGDEKKAGFLALTELRSNLKRWGVVGAEFRSAIQDPQRQAEMMRRYADMGSSYDQIANALGDKSPAGLAARAAANALSSTVLGNKGGGLDAINAAIQGAASNLSEMDPNSKEYQQAVAAYGSNEVGRGVIQSAVARSNAVKQMSGKGRRGWAGAADSAMGLLTGNAIGDMQFTIGGRQINRNQQQVLFRALNQGGEQGAQALDQLKTKLTELGVKDAGSIVSEFGAAAKGGLTNTESKALYDKLGKNEDLKRIQREGVERAQKANDPLGVERNNLLTEIRDRLPKPQGGHEDYDAQMSTP